MEALWTKFLPHYHTVLQMIRDGKIGEIKSVTANFGFKPVPPLRREYMIPHLPAEQCLTLVFIMFYGAECVRGNQAQ